jgi:sortase (surface protein transpeptidase)
MPRMAERVKRRRPVVSAIVVVLVAAVGTAGGVRAAGRPSGATDRPRTAVASQAPTWSPAGTGEQAGGRGTEPVVPASDPTTLTIPAIGVRAPVGQVALAGDGTIETPPLDQPALTAWYREGPTPGEPGSAVVLGHVDSRTGPVVFFRLRELKPGDRIEVIRKDGSTVVFAVDSVGSVPKSKFPTEQVYGDQQGAVLRLITCGGDFDSGRGSYRDNVIASATLVSYHAA